MHEQQFSAQQSNYFDLDQSYNGPVPAFLKHTVSVDAQQTLIKQCENRQSSNQVLANIQQQKSQQALETIQNEPISTVQQKKQKNLKIASQTKYQPYQQTKIIKKKTRIFGKKSPDYKKNICGYITKKILKQMLGKQYFHILIGICQMFNVQPRYFQKTFKSFQVITGPTHLYNLINPRLNAVTVEQRMKQINVKRAFVCFFMWFLRHRYLRYIIKEGKMQRKDVYIHYKNRELLHLITQERQLSEASLKQRMQKINAQAKISSEVAFQTIFGEVANNLFKDAYLNTVQQNFMQKQNPLIKQENFEQNDQEKIDKDDKQENNYIIKQENHQMNRLNPQISCMKEQKYYTNYEQIYKLYDQDLQMCSKQKQSFNSKGQSYDELTFGCINSCQIKLE